MKKTCCNNVPLRLEGRNGIWTLSCPVCGRWNYATDAEVANYIEVNTGPAEQRETIQAVQDLREDLQQDLRSAAADQEDHFLEEDLGSQDNRTSLAGPGGY